MAGVTLSEADEKLLAENRGGKLSLLNFIGHTSYLNIDGQLVTMQPFETFSAIGDLSGNFLEDGKLRFSGIARAVWKEGIRFNLTRWEKWEWTERSLLLMFFGSILAMIFRIIASRLKNDNPIEL